MTTDKRNQILKKIGHIRSHPGCFEELCFEVFHYQRRFNPVYSRYLDLLGFSANAIHEISQIPFLPIEAFKKHCIKTGDWQEETAFLSSGTTESIPSRHFVRSIKMYHNRVTDCFDHFYNMPNNYCFLALLPSYLEREGSSLIAMMQYFISRTKFGESGFYLHDFQRLAVQLQYVLESGIPSVLFGVSHALLRFSEVFPMDLSQIIIMETGGMKGRRNEIPKKDFHHMLCQAFQTEVIHAEYGMTELFSQAYSKGMGLFRCPPGMSVFATEINDPFAPMTSKGVGRLHIIDLANIDTCSFIATDDLGRVHQDGSFEILGRMDHSELRGCNLLFLE